MERLIEQQIIALQNAKTATEITEYAKYFVHILAENARLTKQLENSVQLPCKVGDSVYWSRKSFDDETEEYIFYVEKGHIGAMSQDLSDKERGEWWFRGIYDTGLTYWHTNEDLGTSVFLTKAEAEARLKEILEVENER